MGRMVSVEEGENGQTTMVVDTEEEEEVVVEEEKEVLEVAMKRHVCDRDYGRSLLLSLLLRVLR